MNDAAINIGVHFFSLFSGSGIARSYGRSIFNFLWNLHTVSVVAASIYIPINSARGFPLITSSPILFFLITAILIGVRCYLTVVLICISLMISDVEHFFICLLAICLFYFKICLFKDCAPSFLTGCLEAVVVVVAVEL